MGSVFARAAASSASPGASKSWTLSKYCANSASRRATKSAAVIRSATEWAVDASFVLVVRRKDVWNAGEARLLVDQGSIRQRTSQLHLVAAKPAVVQSRISMGAVSMILRTTQLSSRGR